MSESSLSYTFKDLYEDVLEYQGVNRDTTDTGDIAKAKRRVNDAYRKFLAFDWDFCSRPENLTILDGRYEYELPDDFGSFRTPFIQVSGTNYYSPSEVTYEALMMMRSGSTSEGTPYVYCIASEYDVEVGIRYKALFYPTPSQTFNYIYRYKVITDELSGDDDIPLCPAGLSHLLRAFCLSEVEQFDEEGSKDNWTSSLYSSLLPVAMAKNAVKAPKTVGDMNNAGGGYGFPTHPSAGNTITVNGNTYHI